MNENNNKKGLIRKIVLWVLITNIVTISALIFLPVPIFGMKLVSNKDYDFLTNYRKFVRVESILKKNYVDAITPKQEEAMIEGAINGMTNALKDPYTTYMNKKDYESFLTMTTGSYAGVGILLSVKEDKLVVVEPIEGGPSVAAGIKPGDVIIKVDGKPVNGKENDKAIAMMKGDEGTQVTITVNRAGASEQNIKITRQIIHMKTVKSEIIKGTGYVRISSFDEVTGEEFKEAVDSLVAKGINGLILDLRDNPGGILEESIKVLDVLLDKQVVLSTVDNGGNKTKYTTNNGKINVPITVLVNKGSASASEIVSGALKDLKAATLIGTTTYGKGLVQATKDLQDNTALKFTISRYYTPSGVSIQGKGIEPNIVIEIPEKKNILSFDDDPQVQKALEVIKSK